MSKLKLEREFMADPESVFAFVTQTENLLKWWGHEGMTITEHNLDFTKTGTWSSVLMNAEGGTHKVTGAVVAVNPPHSVEFTWAWHDENNVRGHNSTVRFEISSNGSGGTKFTMVHSGLADEDSVANHQIGWVSTFKKLQRLAN